jgi:hypothetical protein
VRHRGRAFQPIDPVHRIAFTAVLVGLVSAGRVVALPATRDARDVVTRVVVAGVSVIAWVTAEALWRRRAWAFRAAQALSVSTVGCVAAATLAQLVRGRFADALTLGIAAVVGRAISLDVLDEIRTMQAQPLRRPRP